MLFVNLYYLAVVSINIDHLARFYKRQKKKKDTDTQVRLACNSDLILIYIFNIVARHISL